MKPLRSLFVWTLALMAVPCSVAAEIGNASPRTPQYPLKTQRTLRTGANIANARNNIAKFPTARKMADNYIKAADKWLDWSDQELLALITPASVPRAFDVGTVGCPKCGRQLYEKYGAYPWICDLKKPFKVTCPVDGTVYPTNDYDAWYHSGFTEKKNWDTEFVDDGWGYVDSAGEMSWFVAHWNHWLWHRNIAPGVRALGLAYQFTGDKRYAHKAAVMLYRIAEVYPAMDHEPQSRYGTMMRARGLTYPGKVLNAIWETSLVRSITEAYDSVWETIDADLELKQLTGKNGKTLRGFIEANFLEDVLDAWDQRNVSGNFGMHQSVLAALCAVRQYCDAERRLDAMLGQSSGPVLRLGLEYALYNNVYRDGLPFETSPMYNGGWVTNLSLMADILQKAGRNMYALPRMRSLYDGMLDQVMLGKYFPSVGDAGSVFGYPADPQPTAMFSAWRQYKSPAYARWLPAGKEFPTVESLFQPKVPIATVKPAPPKSRLLDGYGMGILNNPDDSVAFSLYYGLKGGHGHFDRLNFEFFALGQPMIPDLGYPDAMNDFVSGIYTWSKNTISHNTVTVDASRQPANVHGTVHLFADGPFARVIDVDGAGTYPQTKAYRRKLVMVDIANDRSYLVDFFDVSGGKQHDYSLHGPPGTFTVKGGTWNPAEGGTLAGPDVPLGAFYDAPQMAQPGYKGGYSGYQGSGFQHLTKVRRLLGGTWSGEYTHQKDPKAKLEIRVLNAPGQEVVLAEARVSPVNHPEILTYIIARRKGDNPSSRFVSVMEPFRGSPGILSAALLKLEKGTGSAVEVKRTGETDIIIHGVGATLLMYGKTRISTDAGAVVVTLNAKGNPVRVFFAGGTTLAIGAKTWTAVKRPSGVITGVNAVQRTIRIKPDGPVTPAVVKALEGSVVHFVNSRRRTAHTVASAKMDGKDLLLTTRDDLLIGRARITESQPRLLVTKTPFGFAPAYTGAAVTDSTFGAYAPVSLVDEKGIHIMKPLDAIVTDQDVWLVDVSPDNKLDAPPVFSWSEATKAR